VGEAVAEVTHGSQSQTKEAVIYKSKTFGMYIIDTPGLNATQADLTNEDIMAKIIQITALSLNFKAKIDAILVMWNPLESKKSMLSLTLKNLSKVFGESVLGSCIAIIHGDWKKRQKELEQAVQEEMKIIKKFGVPLLFFDAHYVDDPNSEFKNQDEELYAMINSVTPFAEEEMEKCRRKVFYDLYKALKFMHQIRKDPKKNF